MSCTTPRGATVATAGETSMDGSGALATPDTSVLDHTPVLISSAYTRSRSAVAVTVELVDSPSGQRCHCRPGTPTTLVETKRVPAKVCRALFATRYASEEKPCGKTENGSSSGRMVSSMSCATEDMATASARMRTLPALPDDG